MSLDKKDVREVVKQLSSRPIAYHRIFTAIAGTVPAGVLLSQIVYWSSVMKGKEFYKTDENFAHELGMSVYELRSAKFLLRDLKLVQVTRKGLPAKTHYKLNEKDLIDSVIEAIKLGEEVVWKHNLSKGYIYLADSAGLTKIGRTKNIQEREEALEKDVPGIEFIYSVSSGNTIKDERKLHEMFKDKRVKGEWFDLSDKDIQMIKSIEMTSNKIKTKSNTKIKTMSKTGSSFELKHNNIKNNIENTIEENKPTLAVGTNLDNLSEKEKNSVFLIFEFWNLYKYPGKWQSHNKLSFDIISAIQENLKNYTDEEICDAIALYASVLQEDKYFWDYVWPLSTFLTVKYEKHKDSPKKWWQFLPENFVEKKYIDDSKIGIEKVEDPDPLFTKKVIKAYAWLINNDKYKPTSVEMIKFIKTTKKMLEFYKDRSIIKTNWIKYLKKCLEKNYGNKGETLYPGHMCGDHTWNVLMPQFLSELGV